MEGYNRLDSTEFWSLHILENTLGQIQYFMAENIFRDRSFPLLLMEQLSQLLTHQKSMAKSALKHRIGQPPAADSGAFSLYHNEIAHTNNTFHFRQSQFFAKHRPFVCRLHQILVCPTPKTLHLAHTRGGATTATLFLEIGGTNQGRPKGRSCLLDIMPIKGNMNNNLSESMPRVAKFSAQLAHRLPNFWRLSKRILRVPPC
jgi:hypothetical protein